MNNPLTTLARWFVPQPEDFQARSIDYPSFQTQLAAIRTAQAQPRPWRQAGVTEALGVPAILAAVSLISNTVGRLSMEAYQEGRLVTDRLQIPRLIVRPNPKTTPREFFRDTAFYLSTRGEAWWWVAHRDVDMAPDALFVVPPWQVVVEANQRDQQNPKVTWLNKVMDNRDMRHITYLPDSMNLRGVGPLQLAGAAVSVTVEADNWAANFFSGSLPSMVGTTDQDLDETDLTNLDAQWLEKPNNLPRWMTNGMTLQAAPFDAQKAQLTESRQHQVGEVARMYDMPGPLLEYQMSGSSLTYRNEEDIWTDFQRRCLSPHYLEPIEQEISDLLTRAVTAKFNTWELTRADMLTRYQVYESGITKSGVLTVDDARRMEGLAPGDVNYMPVPPSPPSADYGPVPFQMLSKGGEWRCSNCRRKIAEEQGIGTMIRCRCGTMNVGQAMQTRAEVQVQPAPQVYVFNALPAPGAPQVNVTSEAPNLGLHEVAEAVRAFTDREQVVPQITVEAPQITNQVAAPEGIKELADAMRVIAEREPVAPQVTMEAPQVHVDVQPATITPPNVEIYPSPISVQPANVVVNIPEQRLTQKKVKRDKQGNIVSITEEPV